jgi:ankyrin repeat protein
MCVKIYTGYGYILARGCARYAFDNIVAGRARRVCIDMKNMPCEIFEVLCSRVSDSTFLVFGYFSNVSFFGYFSMCLQIGQTALQRAAGEGHREVVKELLRAGADPDKQDELVSSEVFPQKSSTLGFAKVLRLNKKKRRNTIYKEIFLFK